jgi:DcuC family C4-dicarboxylate transporter
MTVIVSTTISLLAIVLVIYLLSKQYQPQTVLLCAGFLLMFIGGYAGFEEILPAEKSTGSIFFDAFQYLSNIFSTRIGHLGMDIMCGGAFAFYMIEIGASQSLVRIITKPFLKLKSPHPYAILSFSWIIGMCTGLCFETASSLAILLMVTLFPIMTKLGVSKLSAAAVIASSLCFDWAPGDNALIAEMIGWSQVSYWAHYEVPIVLTAFVFVAPAFYLTQKYFDRKSHHDSETATINRIGTRELDAETAPNWYAVLPVIPALTMVLLSPVAFAEIDITPVTAILFSFGVSMLAELIRKRNLRYVFAGTSIFFEGMGKQMARVITLVVSGQIFGKGLMTMGVMDNVINWGLNSGLNAPHMILCVVLIVSLFAICMGSGSAPFYAFVGLVPRIAKSLQFDQVYLLLPMQFAISIARTVSPLTAVIVITAEMAGVSRLELIQRTAIPMAVSMTVHLIVCYYFYLIQW